MEEILIVCVFTKTLLIIKALVGGGGVGSKSALIFKFITDHFIDDYDPTIEDLYKTHCLVDNILTSLFVIDTAGQEEYSLMRDQYMKVCQGFLVGYAITSRSSFDEVDTFIEQAKRVKRKDKVPMVLVANKFDLESERQVSTEEGELKAKSYGIPFFEISVKSGLNVRACIEELIREVRTDKLWTVMTANKPKKGFLTKIVNSKRSEEIPTDARLYVPRETRKYIRSGGWEEIRAAAVAKQSTHQCGFKDWLLQNDMLDLHTIMAKLNINTAEEVHKTVLVMSPQELRKHELYVSFQYRFREALDQWNGYDTLNSNDNTVNCQISNADDVK